MKQSKQILTGLLLALLLLFVTGCASTSHAPTEAPSPKIPATWLGPCSHPGVDPRTAKGLTQGLIEYETALRACNGQISDIRGWLQLNGIYTPAGEGQEGRTQADKE